MFCLLCLLLFSTAALAQPVAEPWTVAEIPASTSSCTVFVTTRNDTIADVFWQCDTAAIYHAAMNLQDGSALAPPVSIHWQRGGTFATESPCAHNDGLVAACSDDVVWTVLVNEMYHDSMFKTLISGADVENSRSEPVAELTQWGGAPIGGSVWDECARLWNPRVGQLLGTWTRWNCSWNWDFGCCYASGMAVDFADPELRNYTCTPGLFIEGQSEFHVDLEGNLLLATYGYNGLAVCAFNGSIFDLVWAREFTCLSQAHRMLVTPGGHLLVLGSDGLFELDTTASPPESETGICIPLTDFSATPDLISARPHYGFAWINSTPSSITLSRCDTNGVFPAFSGLVRWRSDTTIVAEVALTLTSAGRSVILWREHTTFPEPSPDRLYLTAVDWTTPLSADPSDFIPQPSTFTLTAFPNPFNSELQIEYQLAQRGRVDLSIYNTLGQQVAKLGSAVEEAGLHKTTWRSAVASGLYLVTLQQGGSIFTQKVLYLR